MPAVFPPKWKAVSLILTGGQRSWERLWGLKWIQPKWHLQLHANNDIKCQGTCVEQTLYWLHFVGTEVITFLLEMLKAGDFHLNAGERETRLKILRLPPNMGELTAMMYLTGKKCCFGGFHIMLGWVCLSDIISQWTLNWKLVWWWWNYLRNNFTHICQNYIFLFPRLEKLLAFWQGQVRLFPKLLHVLHGWPIFYYSWQMSHEEY